MISVRHLVCNMLQENCYIASDETNECVVIDCGAYYPADREALLALISEENLRPVRLLCTHGHLDHCFGNNTMLEKYGLKPEISEPDKGMLTSYKRQAREFYRLELDYDLPPAGSVFGDGDTIEFGRSSLKVIATPGHSRGSVCFYSKDDALLFSGDTLFAGSIGRTDFASGSMMQIIQSLRMLAQLPDDTRVMPGHGPSTTIGYELQHNPYLDR